MTHEARVWLASSGAHARPHSGRMLIDHLEGTWRLLNASGQREAVCLGGLFHSVYGTNAFRTATAQPAQRPEVQLLIGAEAESLAWIFGHIKRPQVLVAAQSTTGRETVLKLICNQFGTAVSRQTIEDLTAIECANLLEQGVLWKTSGLAQAAQRLGIVSGNGFAATC